MKNYYKILEVSKDANQKDIKKAFRKLALKFHPDKNPNNEEAANKFKDVAEAYETLSNEEKKAYYDRGGGRPFDGFGNFREQSFSFTSNFDPHDLFERVSSGSFGRKSQPQENFNIISQVIIDVEKAFEGGSEKVKINRRRCCEECDGTGAEGEVETESCPLCNGQGFRIMNQAPFYIKTPCDACRGEGKKIKNKCKKCQGIGFLLETEDYNLKIPRGSREGVAVKVREKGHQRKDKTFGEALFQIKFNNHPLFQVAGENVYSQIPIPIHYVFTGGKIKVRTLHSVHSCDIPPNINQEHYLEFKGEGFPLNIGSTEHGDHIVRIVFELPTGEIKKEIMEKMKEISVGEEVFPNFNKSQKDL